MASLKECKKAFIDGVNSQLKKQGIDEDFELFLIKSIKGWINIVMPFILLFIIGMPFLIFWIIGWGIASCYVLFCRRRNINMRMSIKRLLLTWPSAFYYFTVSLIKLKWRL